MLRPFDHFDIQYIISKIVSDCKSRRQLFFKRILKLRKSLNSLAVADHLSVLVYV